jgi:hypothetical protein
MKIIVIDQISSGSLCVDSHENEAANALAEYTRLTWETDLSEFVKSGHEVDVNIAVQHNTSGASRHVSVYIDPWTMDVGRLEDAVRHALTDEHVIWERFCELPESARFSMNQHQ